MQILQKELIKLTWRLAREREGETNKYIQVQEK